MPDTVGAATSGHTHFPAVVAIGASAGGLEAFTELLRALPKNTGMAFVFIQHLDPHHHSILSELLAKSASMPVIEAKHRMAIEPNHIYVIPPNVNMGILQGRLQLSPRADEQGLHAPIDFFMRALAEARNSRSIGIVLSGTASDGTRGLAAIKAEGGLTFAQDERSAKYPGMPHSAIATGCVDFILPPARIARELARISGHLYFRPHSYPTHSRTAGPAKRKDDSFERIFALLRNAGGVNFAQYKPGTVQRRALRRMAIHKIDHLADYAQFLQKHPEEIEELCQDLLIPVTSFFRDLESFEALKTKVFPSILKNKVATHARDIRIWAPGCSTGEETYSLAIVLLEFLGDQASSFQIQLFGTDANERGINKARGGIYHERIALEVSPARLRRFFTKLDEGYRVGKTLRDLCVFAKHNLAEDPPFSRMDVVACRNLLMYFGTDLQRQVVPILHYALRPSGFLMLGNAESTAAFADLFAPLDKKHKIFAKKPVPGRLHYDFSAHRYPREAGIASLSKEQAGPFLDLAQQHQADHIVLQNYAPPGVLIDEDMQVLQFRGAIGPYLQPAPGRASLHLLKIARSEFSADLRAAIDQAKKNHAPVKRKLLTFHRHGRSRSVNLSVEPLGSPKQNRQYLVLFESALPPVSPPKANVGKLPEPARSGKTEIAHLRRKLAAAQQSIRSLVEATEARDEEYQSANEEILSANEELQSTNEELETSKEELQSANEELNTVNDELHNRNVDLDRVNSDLHNLLASTTLPMVMVDRGLRIRRVTPAAAKTLKMLLPDVGRPITDIRSDINLPDLEELITGVIDSLTPQELELQDKANHWYSLQIRPYRTTDDKIDGAVLVLSDIDAVKQVGQRFKESKEFIEHVVATVREPLLVLDERLRVLYASASFLKAFKVSRQETEGKFLYRLGNEQWDIPKLRAALEQVTSGNTPVVDFEVQHDFPSLGLRTMLLGARKIEDANGREPMMLLAIEDVTERQQTQDALRASQERLHFIMESGPHKIFTATPNGDRDYFNRQYLEFTGLPFEQVKDRGWTRAIHPDDLDATIRGWQRSLDTGEPFEIENRLRRADGEYRWHLSRAHAVRDARGQVVMWIGAQTDIDDTKHAEQLLQARVQERTSAVRRLSASLLQSQDEERRRISRELHDSVGQYLAHAKMSVETLRRPPASEKHIQALSHIAETLEKCLAETRTMSYLLHPPALDELGFCSAARWYLEGFCQRSGIQVNVNMPDGPDRMIESRGVELALFRVLQESLTNAHRYSGSASVDVSLKFVAKQAILEVRDYGKGLSPDLLRQIKTTGVGGGVGLNGMRERIVELGGRFEVQSGENGTLISAAVPVSATAPKTATASASPTEH